MGPGAAPEKVGAPRGIAGWLGMTLSTGAGASGPTSPIALAYPSNASTGVGCSARGEAGGASAALAGGREGNGGGRVEGGAVVLGGGGGPENSGGRDEGGDGEREGNGGGADDPPEAPNSEPVWRVGGGGARVPVGAREG